jgi:hypothetical protein
MWDVWIDGICFPSTARLCVERVAAAVSAAQMCMTSSRSVCMAIAVAVALSDTIVVVLQVAELVLQPAVGQHTVDDPQSDVCAVSLRDVAATAAMLLLPPYVCFAVSGWSYVAVSYPPSPVGRASVMPRLSVPCRFISLSNNTLSGTLPSTLGNLTAAV